MSFLVILLLSLPALLLGGGVNILNSENKFGTFNKAACSYVCSGTTRRVTTRWHATKGITGDSIWTRINISNCRFRNIPTVLASLESPIDMVKAPTATLSVHTYSNYFDVLVHRVGGINTEEAIEMQWNVDWAAIGYIC